MASSNLQFSIVVSSNDSAFSIPCNMPTSQATISNPILLVRDTSHSFTHWSENNLLHLYLQRRHSSDTLTSPVDASVIFRVVARKNLVPAKISGNFSKIPLLMQNNCTWTPVIMDKMTQCFISVLVGRTWNPPECWSVKPSASYTDQCSYIPGYFHSSAMVKQFMSGCVASRMWNNANGSIPVSLSLSLFLSCKYLLCEFGWY